MYYTIRIGSTPTFLYFDLYLDSAYAAHYVYLIINRLKKTRQVAIHFLLHGYFIIIIII